MSKLCKKQWVPPTKNTGKTVHVCAREKYHRGQCLCFCQQKRSSKEGLQVCDRWMVHGANLSPDQFKANEAAPLQIGVRQIDLEAL